MTKRHFFRNCCFFFAVLGSVVVSDLTAGITFDSPPLIEIDQETLGVIHKFSFKNTGRSPVKILSAKPSCGCGEAKFADKTYLPGEVGSVELILKDEKPQGTYDLWMVVETSDKKTPIIKLPLKLKVNSPVSLSSRLLLWEMAESENTKFIDVNINKNVNINLKNISSDNQLVNVKWITKSSDKAYQIVVTPKNTSKPFNSKIEINLMLDDKPKTYVVYACILK